MWRDLLVYVFPRINGPHVLGTVEDFYAVRTSAVPTTTAQDAQTSTSFCHHVFLSHDWTVDTHAAVQRINQALLALGVVTWFSDDVKEHPILLPALTRGLDSSAAFVSFITPSYEAKVNSSSITHFCGVEFRAALNCRERSNMLAVILDKTMIDRPWQGVLGPELTQTATLDAVELDAASTASRIHEHLSRLMVSR